MKKIMPFVAMMGLGMQNDLLEKEEDARNFRPRNEKPKFESKRKRRKNKYKK